MTPLVIIPARAGSKGVPNKNFAPLPDGSTLVSRAVEIGAQLGAAIVVSTDHPSAREHSEHDLIRWLVRPTALAQDDTPMMDVIDHVLGSVPGDTDQQIVLLQPTTPFRTVAHYHACVASFLERDQPYATVRAIPSPYWRSHTLLDGRYLGLPITRRQDAAPRYIFSGECYLTSRRWWRQSNLYRAVVIESQPYVNIDTPADWDEACRIIRLGLTAGTVPPSGAPAPR